MRVGGYRCYTDRLGRPFPILYPLTGGAMLIFPLQFADDDNSWPCYTDQYTHSLGLHGYFTRSREAI